jgi:signal transduction histidine kinase
MKLQGETWLPRLVVIVPFAVLVVIAAACVYWYAERLVHYFEEEKGHCLEAYIEAEKSRGEAYVGALKQLFSEKNSRIEEKMKTALKERVGIAHETADSIYEKYNKKLSDERIRQQIADALERIVWHKERQFVWITDYEGNSILPGSQHLGGENISSYADADGRAIILEEIQTVRREGEGFLQTRFREGEGEQLMLVKDFGHYDWFFGSALLIDAEKDALKASLLRIVQEMPMDKRAFLAIFDKERNPLFISEAAGAYLNEEGMPRVAAVLKEAPLWDDLTAQNTLLYSDYFEPFGWHLLYGSDTAHFKSVVDLQEGQLFEKIDDEMYWGASAAAVFGLLIILFSLFISRRITALFSEHAEEVGVREDLLRELNASFETRVRDEVEANREEEKMLIQKSKMAAMGEMLSMIAHQWRQPLNRLSCILTDIEGSYGSKKLTQERLDEGLREGADLLESMAHTINDYEEFFEPDKEREEVVIADVVAQTLPLIEKSLEARKITLQYLLDCNVSLMIFRNELMQVILNVINNAKEALLERKVENPRIMIETVETGQFVIITVCDNAGGIDDAIAEKIFDPYFTTKERSGGSGLGLYMSKTIMEARLNGELRFENRKEGACFLIKIGKQQFLEGE